MPYIRRHDDFKPEEVKYEFECTETKSKTVQKKALDAESGTLKVTETYTETYEETRRKKVYLKCYGQTEKEDAICFFKCYTKMLKELADEVKKSSQSKDTDASILFKAMDRMLVESANANWLTILRTTGMEPENTENGRTKTTWEVYKRLVAQFICTQVYSEPGIYDQQVKYMQGRHKPKSLTAKEWHRKFEEYNTYMCYLFPDLQAMKRQFPALTFKDWMTKDAGALTVAQERRVILDNVKESWKDALRLHDIGRTYREQKSPSEIVDYYTTLEGLEQHRARQTPNGRQVDRRNHTANQARSGYNRQERRGQQGSRNRYNRENRHERRGQHGSRQGRDHNRQGYNQRIGNGNGNSHRNGNGNGNGNHHARNGNGNGNGNHNGGNDRNHNRDGGQRHGGSNYQQQRPHEQGRFQGQDFRSRYQRPSGQAYFQEDDRDAYSGSESDNHDEINQLDQAPEEPEEKLTEAQWLEQWNNQFKDNLYLDASDASNQTDDDYYDEDEHYGIEDECEDVDGGFDYAAIDGSGYL